MDKKKLLIYAHYYVPDTASTGQIVSELAESMLDKFDITVICVVPSYMGTIEDKYKTKKYYEENINGVKVLRIRVPEFNKKSKKSRVKNLAAYFLGAMSATMKLGGFDYVFSISQPPIMGGLLGVWGKWTKRAKFIYNIQDFNPEQVLAVNYVHNPFVHKVSLALDKFSCRQSDLVITVGHDLVDTMHKRFAGKKVPKTVMINNWIDEKEIYPLPQDNEGVLDFKRRYGLEDKFVVMYSGNIGLYYDLENLIEVIRKFAPGTKASDGREVVFAFVGAGFMLEKLQSYVETHNMTNVVFIPYQDKAHLKYSLNAADVHWCVNAKGIKGVSCPSKAYGIMAAGKAILGVLERGSEVRMIIDDTKCGLCCEPQDYESVENNLKWFIDNADSEEIINMGARGRENLERNLTRTVSVRKYEEEILKL